MTSLVHKTPSPCEIFPPSAAAALLGLGVRSKNEQIKQFLWNKAASREHWLSIVDTSAPYSLDHCKQGSH